MADDRIYIVCKECKKQKLLLKFYAGDSHLWNCEEIEDFLLKHLDMCHPRGFHYDLNGEPGFELTTESDKE